MKGAFQWMYLLLDGDGILNVIVFIVRKISRHHIADVKRKILRHCCKVESILCMKWDIWLA